MRRTVSAAAATNQLPTLATAAALVAPANRGVNLRIAFAASADHAIITNNAVHYGGVPGVYTNVVNAGTNLSVTISNLAPRTRYYFAARSTSNAGIVGPLSPEIFWPQPFTNYVVVGIKTNDQVIVQLIYTNPPGDVVLFTPFIMQTNNSVSVLRLPAALLVANTNQP